MAFFLLTYIERVKVKLSIIVSVNNFFVYTPTYFKKENLKDT